MAEVIPYLCSVVFRICPALAKRSGEGGLGNRDFGSGFFDSIRMILSIPSLVGRIASGMKRICDEGVLTARIPHSRAEAVVVTPS
jgi:hypothetical protein